MSTKYTVTSTINNPVDLSLIKSFLRITHSSDDTLLDLLNDSALELMEGMTTKVFTDRDFELLTDEICVDSEGYSYIEINRSPVTEVSDVLVYSDTDEAYTTISGSYIVELNDAYSRIYFTESITLGSDVALPFKVVFSAGFETAPAELKMSIVQLISYNYENRGDVISEGALVMPKELYQIIDRYRMVPAI